MNDQTELVIRDFNRMMQDGHPEQDVVGALSEAVTKIIGPRGTNEQHRALVSRVLDRMVELGMATKDEPDV